MARRQLAVVGGGWAGLAAAVAGTQAGDQLSLFEMAGQLGGRARSLPVNEGAGGGEGEDKFRLDNGQHILIGAYTRCLALLRTVGVDGDAALLRMPLRLRYPQHEGLRLPPGPPLISFARGVLAHPTWPLAARLQLLSTATRWLLGGFRCAPMLTVEQLCAGLSPVINAELIAPLCVAALNTPAPRASAQVFLRVLHDALFSGPGSADLLLPRLSLSALLAVPAAAWLQAHGADIRLGSRVQTITPHGHGWRVDGQAFDAVILACPSGEAARLIAPLNPDWAASAAALSFEPIITVYLQSPGSRLPAPMVALQDGEADPAQFIFDLRQLGHTTDLFAMVVSGAAPWVARGLAATGAATLAQARRELCWHTPPQVLRVLAEKRATFACTPGLQRPAANIAPNLIAAGDYVAGPYPATLEGAVRSGEAAVSRRNTG